jgi:hypothetical protein
LSKASAILIQKALCFAFNISELVLFEIVLPVLLIQLSSIRALSFFPGVRLILSGGSRYPLDAMVVRHKWGFFGSLASRSSHVTVIFRLGSDFLHHGWS